MGVSASGWPRGRLPSGRPAGERPATARGLRGGAVGGGAFVAVLGFWPPEADSGFLGFARCKISGPSVA